MVKPRSSFESSDTHADLLAALTPERRAHVLAIHARLTDAGHECYLVGGAVRDLLLGRTAGDIDLTTNAHPAQVQKLFRRTVPTGLQHGTVTVLMPEQKNTPVTTENFEVTTYRAESDYSDARRPDSIAFAETLEDDLSRRDFTVNALAYDCATRELVDRYAGLQDLRDRILRTIGQPRNRFFEDGLRTIRACRFAATLAFEIEAETARALRDPEVQARTAQVSIERFTDELFKGLRAGRPSVMLGHLEATGLLALFFPESFPGPTTPRIAREVDALPADRPVLRLALWCDRLSFRGAALTELAGQLRFSKKQIRDLEWSQSYLRFLETEPSAANPDAVTRRWLSGLKAIYGAESAAFLNGLAALPAGTDGELGDPAALSFARLTTALQNDPLVIGDLALRGPDLMERGIKGPAIGATLRALLDQVLVDPQLNTRDALLQKLTDLPGEVP